MTGREARHQAIISSVLLLLNGFVVADSAKQIQLLYPDNNVSSKPIIEFRARTDSLTGHAFVAVGRLYDNGMEAFYATGGFYPATDDSNKLTTFYVLVGPGEVSYKPVDLRSDLVFRVNVTPEQERTALFILKNWDQKLFSLPIANCVSLVNDIAQSIGLKVDKQLFGIDSDLDFMTPGKGIQFLKDNNDADTPIRHAELRRSEAKLQRDAINRDQYRREKKRYEREMSIRAEEQLRSAVVGEASRAASGTSAPTRPVAPPPWQPVDDNAPPQPQTPTSATVPEPTLHPQP